MMRAANGYPCGGVGAEFTFHLPYKQNRHKMRGTTLKNCIIFQKPVDNRGEICYYKRTMYCWILHRKGFYNEVYCTCC